MRQKRKTRGDRRRFWEKRLAQQQEAAIRAAADAEIAKIQADLDEKLKANAAQQAEVTAQMAKEP